MAEAAVKYDTIGDELISALVHVQKQIGQVHTEFLVSAALCEELKDRGYTVEREAPIPAWFTTSIGKRRLLGVLKADIIASKEEHTALIEIKSLNNTKTNIESARRQVECYMRFSDRVFTRAYALFFPKRAEEPPSIIGCTDLLDSGSF